MYNANDIIIKNLILPYTKIKINIELKRGINYIKGNNGTGKTLLLDYISGIRKDTAATISGNLCPLIIWIVFSNFAFTESALNNGLVVDIEYWVAAVPLLNDFIDNIFQDRWDKGKIALLMKKQWGMLSGGERKYIYILILMSIEREWYILDEPFAFLDDEKREIIWYLINIKTAQGKGIILTSHGNEIENIPSDANIIDLGQ